MYYLFYSTEQSDEMGIIIHTLYVRRKKTVGG